MPTNTVMMFLPAIDTSLKPTMMVLPDTQSSQTLMKLPPTLHAATGMEVVAVPAGIKHIVVASTLEEASALFERYKLQPGADLAPPQGAVKKSLLASQALGTPNTGSAQSTTQQSPAAAEQQLRPVSVEGNRVESKNAAAVAAVQAPAVAGVSSRQTKASVSVSAAQRGDQKPGKCAPASAAVAKPNRTTVSSPPAEQSSARAFASPTSSVRSPDASGRNNSQASECTTSPSLFGDTQKSQSPKDGKTPPPARPKPAPRAVKIPSPTRMTTRSKAGSCGLSSAGGASSPSVVLPSPGVSTRGASSPSVVLPSPEVSTRERRETPDSSKTSAEADPREQDEGYSNVKTLLRKQLFRNTPRKGGTSSDSLTTPDQPSAAACQGNETHTLNKADESGESSDSVLVKEAAPAADLGADKAGSGGEEETKLQRRVRGSKRRSLSLGRSGKRKRCDDLLDDISQVKMTEGQVVFLFDLIDLPHSVIGHMNHFYC